jgi:hypothetical protein
MAMGMMELGSAISATEFEEAVLKNNKEIRAILDGKAKDSQSSGSRRGGAGVPKMLSHMWLAFEIENHVYERAKRDSEITDDKEPFSSSAFMIKYNLFNDMLKNNMQTCDKLGRRLGSKQKSEYMVDQYCKSSIGAKKRKTSSSSHSHSSSHRNHHNSAASSSAMDAAAAWDTRFGKGAGGGSQSLPVPAPAASPGLGAAAMGAAATSRPSGLSIQPTIEEMSIDAVEEVELDFGFRLDSPRPTPRPVTTPGASGAAGDGAAAGSVRKLSLTLADLGGGGEGGAAGASQPTTPHGVKATPRPAADASAWGEDEDEEVAAAPDAAHGDAWASAQKDRAAQQQVELERLQRAEAEAAERKAAQEKDAAARQVQAAADAAKRKADEAAATKLEEDRKVRRRRHCKAPRRQMPPPARPPPARCLPRLDARPFHLPRDRSRCRCKAGGLHRPPMGRFFLPRHRNAAWPFHWPRAANSRPAFSASATTVLLTVVC